MSLIEYRFRLRDASDASDVLVVSSVRGDAQAYISSAPSGDGASLDWLSGKCMSGTYTGKIIDAITGGTSRLFTSLTEDAGKRQQLGQRKAFWDFRLDGGAWTVLYAGRLSRYKLDNDIEWTVSVSDWMQAEHEFKLFDRLNDTETIASFLSRFPNRGCLFGGPMGSVLGMPDRGGWVMKVYDASYLSTRQRYRLEPFMIADVNGGLASYDDIAARVNRVVHDLPRPVPEFGTGTFTTIQDTKNPGFGWMGLIVLVDGNPYRAISGAPESGIAPGADVGNLLQTIKGHTGVYIDAGEGEPALTPGTFVRVRALTIHPTEASPIYFAAHPVDLFNTFEGMAGIPVNAAALTTVRNIVGTQALHTLRITEPEQLGTLLDREIYGPWGIGTRPDNNGAIEIFSSRTFVNTPPGVTIGAPDVEADSTNVFDLDIATAIRQLNFQHHRLVKDATRSDGVGENTERIERGNGDPGAIGVGVVDYALNGFVNFINANFDIKKWVDGRAAEIFDRRGRGGVKAKTSLLRSGAGANVKLGDEIIFQHPAVVNHNKRYGDDPSVGGRAMQVTHWTPRAEVIEVELEDAGPNSQPIATIPTLSIAKSTVDGRHIAIITITNAAALIAAGYALRLQFATTSGAAATATDYTDLKYYTNTEIPTGAVTMANVTNGRTVFVRARSEGIAFGRPSAWSAVQSVALDAINAPSGVTATPVVTDGSLCDLAWTIGANATDCHTDIYVRTRLAPFSTAYIVATVIPGTTQYRLVSLVPGSLLTATVVHRYDPIDDQSAQVDVNFACAGATITLPTPTIAAAWCTPPNNRGRFSIADIPAANPGLASLAGDTVLGPGAKALFGMVVKSTAFPSKVSFELATETAIGSGVYGAFAEVARIDSVLGDWTKAIIAANMDGLRRQMRARLVGEGYTSSGYTAIVTIDPKVAVAVPNYVVDFSTDIMLNASLDHISRSDSDTTKGSTIIGQLTNDGNAVNTFGVQEGGSTFKIYRHREDITITGPDADGDVAYTFALTYQNVPMILLRGGQYVTFSNTIGTAVKQKLRLQVLNPTSSGFVSRAQIISSGATTPQANDFASGNSITVSGNTAVLTLNPGSANDNTYTVHYFVSVTVNANATNFSTATLVLAIDTDDGSGFVERATFNYAVSPPAGAPPRPAATNTWTHEQQPIVVSGLVNGTQIRLRAKSFSVSNAGTGSFIVRGGDAGGANPETFDGATYNTAADTTESAIPSSGDSVQWTAQEVL